MSPATTSAADGRIVGISTLSTVTAPEQISYRAELTGVHGNLILSDCTDELPKFILTGITGWFGGVGISANDVQRTLGHGLFPTPAMRTGRVLTLEGYFQLRDSTQRAIAERFVSGVLWNGDLGTLRVMTDDLDLSTDVRLDGEIKYSYINRFLDRMTVQIPLIAPDPFLYGPDQNTTLAIPGIGQGLRLGNQTRALFQKPATPTTDTQDAGYLRWGSALPPAVMGNDGNAEAWPVFTVRGTFPDGFVIRVQGRSIEYPGEVTTRSPITVDTGSGQVTRRGIDVTHMLLKRQWEPIPPYASIVPKLEARNRMSEGWADATWNDTYI